MVHYENIHRRETLIYYVTVFHFAIHYSINVLNGEKFTNIHFSKNFPRLFCCCYFCCVSHPMKKKKHYIHFVHTMYCVHIYMYTIRWTNNALWTLQFICAHWIFFSTFYNFLFFFETLWRAKIDEKLKDIEQYLLVPCWLDIYGCEQSWVVLKYVYLK